MPFYSIESFSHLLELSISPIVLISGVGLLLISQTNRLSRAIDRSRKLVKEIEGSNGSDVGLKRQLHILYRRCRILRSAITLLATSILCAGLIILMISLMSFFGLTFRTLAMVIFFTGIISLVSSIALFLLDIFLGLEAVTEEVKPYLDE